MGGMGGSGVVGMVPMGRAGGVVLLLGALPMMGGLEGGSGCVCYGDASIDGGYVDGGWSMGLIYGSNGDV